MKLRVVETAAGNFAIQRQVKKSVFKTVWVEVYGGYFRTAGDALTYMEKLLENERHSRRGSVVKRVIAEGET